MLISCEQWRKEFGVDDLVKCVCPARLTLHSADVHHAETLTSRRRKR